MQQMALSVSFQYKQSLKYLAAGKADMSEVKGAVSRGVTVVQF
jgi:hypothetical protein